MNTCRIFAVVLTFVVVMSAGRDVVRATPAAPVAQGTSDPSGAGVRRGVRAGRPAPPAPAGMTAQQVEQYLDQVMLNQARTRLRLNDGQFFRFGGALRRLQTLRRQQQRQRMALVRDLGSLTESGAADDALAAKIKELDDFNDAAVRDLQEARAAIDGALDVRQRAQFRVFEEMMERRKLDLLTRARRAAGPSDAPPQAP